MLGLGPAVWSGHFKCGGGMDRMERSVGIIDRLRRRVKEPRYMHLSAGIAIRIGGYAKTT
jgi:hypothetical protein